MESQTVCLMLREVTGAWHAGDGALVKCVTISRVASSVTNILVVCVSAERLFLIES